MTDNFVKAAAGFQALVVRKAASIRWLRDLLAKQPEPMAIVAAPPILNIQKAACGGAGKCAQHKRVARACTRNMLMR